jgi:hypothetical protein
MNSIAISFIVFACVFGGAMLGMFLRAALPEDHLSGDSKDVVRLSVGLVATMSAILLGLLVSAALGSYEAQRKELIETSAQIVLLDRVLAHYGPETKDTRDVLRGAVVIILDRMWPKHHAESTPSGSPVAGPESLFEKIAGLTPKDDAQHMLKAQALNMVVGLGQTRWLHYENSANTVSMPLLVVLVFWLATIFVSFGLFAPYNRTVVASLLISSLSVSCAILLIMELYSPYHGLIELSNTPLRAALAQLGK